jgi:hypothetical protein
MGSALRIEVKSKTTSTSTENSVGADLEASWGGFGATVEGGGGFKKDLAKSNSLSSSKVKVFMMGQDRGEGVSSLSIEDANNELINFAKIASKGTGLALILKRFDSHPDFIKTINDPECKPLEHKAKKIEKRGDKLVYKELVATNTLLDWLDDDKNLDSV